MVHLWKYSAKDKKLISLLGPFIILLILKVPIGFSLFGSSVIYFITHGLNPLIAVQSILAGPNSFTLLAVPGFILAAAIMNTGGITKRIFNFSEKSVGHITGGLGHANIMASVIFAGMSGAAIADIAGLGAIELKAMKDAGYDEDFSLAITGASSLIGPIIPPSIPAVLFAVAASESVGRLFVAGFVPGIIMALSLALFVYFECKRRNFKPHKRASVKELWIAFKEGFFSLLSPVFIIGAIIIGVVTPTEAAMVAVVYAIILGLFYKSISLKDLPIFFRQTLRTTISVMIIVSSASLFGWILASEQIPLKLAHMFITGFSNKYILLLIINVFLIIVGCFMETSSAILILTPVFLPLIKTMGIDPVHFGIIMVLNLMIGLLTPPVGLGLYTLSIISDVPFEKIARSIFPYIILMIILLFIFTYIPGIVMFLPNLLFK